jgi:O-antigen/teichoic acid export membrane protein
MSTPLTTETDTPDQREKAQAAHRPRHLRSVVTNWGAYLISMAVNFFVSPYVVAHLGSVGYGVWTLILSLTGYLGLLDLGVRGAVTRYVARFHSQADHNKSSEVASAAMVIFGSAGVIAILASLIFAFFVIGHFNVPPGYMTAARIVLCLTGLNIATSLVNGVYGGIIIGLQRFDLSNALEIGISLVRAASVVAVLHFGYGIVTLAVVQLGCTVGRWLANVALSRHLYPEVRLRPHLVDRAGIKLIFSFSVFSFLIHVSASLIYASDSIVIGAYLPVAAVTFYVIGGNLVEYARTLVQGISQTMTPLASSLETRSDPKQLQQLVLKSSRWASMVIIPVTCTFLLRGSTFIGLWMGQQYASLSGQVLWVLSLTVMFWGANSSVGAIMLGLSKHKPIVPAIMTEGLCNLILSIFLVKRLGVVGVAWGTAIPSLANSLIFWPWYIRRTLKIQPLTYVTSAWVRPWVSMAGFIAGTYAIERFWPAKNLLVFFLQVALVLPLALIGYWFLCLELEQRETILRKLSVIGFIGSRSAESES